MKKISFLLLAIILANAGFSQNSNRSRLFTFNVGIGGSASTFQDIKYSDVKWSGYGLTPGIDFVWRRNGIHSAGIEGIVSIENPETFDLGKTNFYWGNLYYKYLHPVNKSKNYNLFIGGKLKPFGISMRMVDGLINNGVYLIISSNINAVALFEKQLGKKWVLSTDFGFQIFSVMAENMSFTYSVDQRTLEKGKYNYDEVEGKMYATPFWEYLGVETSINLSYGKRWVFGYLWKMEQSNIMPDYKMTMGYSSLRVVYKIVSKHKKSKNR